MTDYSNFSEEQKRALLAGYANEIHAQNLHLIDRVSMPDFRPDTELDNTLNGGLYKISKFFNVLRLWPHGEVPTEVTDEMVASTERLINSLAARYAAHPDIVVLCKKVAQAFGRSKGVWRIRHPPVPLRPDKYGIELDRSLYEILNALDEFNRALVILPDPPAPRQKRRAPREEGVLNAERFLRALHDAAFGLLGLKEKDRRVAMREYSTGKYWAQTTGLRPNTIGTLVDLKGTFAKKGRVASPGHQLYFEICTNPDLFAVFEDIEKGQPRPRASMPLDQHILRLTTELKTIAPHNPHSLPRPIA